MKSSGNGRPEQCAANLLMMTRGEAPYERLKGLSAGLIDVPSTLAEAETSADIEWLLGAYEPRVDIANLDIVAFPGIEGDYIISAGLVTLGGGNGRT